MFVESTEIAYLNEKEYTDLIGALDVANDILATTHNKKLIRLATNAINALSALISSDNIQLESQEVEEQTKGTSVPLYNLDGYRLILSLAFLTVMLYNDYRK